MQIDVTGPGRHGTLAEGVGKMVLKSETPEEARELMTLLQEIRNGEFRLWPPILWARQQGRLTETEWYVVQRIHKNNVEDFEMDDWRTKCEAIDEAHYNG